MSSTFQFALFTSHSINSKETATTSEDPDRPKRLVGHRRLIAPPATPVRIVGEVVKAEHARVEQLKGRYDLITSRAFASLLDFVTLTNALLAEGAVWMAMKGKQPDDELAVLPSGVNVFHVEQLNVPGLDAQRCLVWMRPD